MNVDPAREDIFKRIDNKIRGVEGSVTNLLSSLAPWGAPAAPTYMTFVHLLNTLEFPLPVALMTAFTVEVMGFASITTALEFTSHNKKMSRLYRENPDEKLRKSFKRAPIEWVIMSYVFYLIVVITINVLLDAFPTPETKIAVRAVVTLLSLPAGLLIGLRKQHSELLRELKEPKRTNERTNEQQNESQNTPNELQNDSVRSPEMPNGDVKNRIFQYMETYQAQNGKAPGPSRIARELNCSKSFAHSVGKEWLKSKEVV